LPCRDIGTIKYLSHGFDDCELHKDLSVYEHLYDEGRSKTDPGDQYVVVKAVFSQGRPLREGSVMPDFDDPRYEHRPIPPVPVPSWSTAPSKPEKRAAEEDDYEQYFGASEYPDAKRQRLSDPDDADSDDDIAQSVEREAVQGVETTLPASQTIIRDSQSSPRRESFQSNRQLPLPETRSSSFRPSLASTSVTTFSPSRRLKYDQASEKSVDLSIPKHLRFDHNHGKTQALLTPPSDASKNSSNGETKKLLTQSSKKKPSLIQASSSGLRRPGTVKKDIYDVEESDDIECSLMSPKSKRASVKKLSRSSSGAKSSPTASRNGKGGENSVAFSGNVPNSEIIRLMEDASYIQPKSTKRPRSAVAHSVPEYNFTADENDYSQQGDVLQEVEEPSTNGSHLPGEHVAYVESKEPVAASLPKATAFEDALDSEAGMDVTASKKPTLSLREKLAAASKQVAREDSPSQPTRRRRKRAGTKDDVPTEALNLVTGFARPETKENTPMDSPGEQLLEMQASSQKSRQDSQSKKTKKIKKQDKTDRERQATASNNTKLSVTDQHANEKQLQKPRSVVMAPSVEKPLTIDTKTAEEKFESESALKSPYARPSPPKGSMGLGVTDSPRRPSTLSASGSSSSSRRLFQTESAPAQVANPVPVANKKSDSDSESGSEDESSDSAAATPSKQAPQDKPTSGGFQRYLSKPKPVAPPQEASAVSRLRTESALRSESPAVIPMGMTFQQYEEMKEKLKNAPPKEKKQRDSKVKKELKAQAEQVLLAIPTNSETTPSAAASEEPEARAKVKVKKAAQTTKTNAVTPNTMSASTRTTKTPANKNLDTAAPKPVVRATTEAKSAPSTIESELSKASQASPTKATKPKSIPSSTASEPSKASQSAQVKPASTTTNPLAIASSSTSSKISQHARTNATPAAIAAPKPAAKALSPTEPPAESLLKKLKHRVADRSARSSPAAPAFALAPKPIAKPRGFKALDDDSDDSESEEDEDDEAEERRVNVVKAARPDQSTRSVANDDEDMDNASEEEDED
jgi:hypothetical protein